MEFKAITLLLINLTFIEIQTAVLEVGVLGLGLAGVMIGAELGHQLGCILSCIDSQRLGDHQQGLGELGNGQLLSGMEKNTSKKNRNYIEGKNRVAKMSMDDNWLNKFFCLKLANTKRKFRSRLKIRNNFEKKKQFF